MAFVILAAVAAASTLLFARTASRHLQVQRAVATGALPAITPWRSSGIPYGASASLQSEPANLQRSLDALQQGGYLWLRQRFPWNDLEPERGVYRWDRYDAIVDAAAQRGLKIIAVLDTSPAWARSSTMVTAPPDNMDDYGRFVAAFVTHYRDRIGHIQIWDQPNVAPNWGDYWASPAEYVAMLKVAYPLAKAANREVMVLGGGLAPTVADDQWNLNDVTYLRRMYALGARGFFDILAAKPYGFWTGPEDRRVDPSILNFSRAILLREIMVKNGDDARPVWAVEMGWNALPEDWQGKPSPWGTDSGARAGQAHRQRPAARPQRMAVDGRHGDQRPALPRRSCPTIRSMASPWSTSRPSPRASLIARCRPMPASHSWPTLAATLPIPPPQHIRPAGSRRDRAWRVRIAVWGVPGADVTLALQWHRRRCAMPRPAPAPGGCRSGWTASRSHACRAPQRGENSRGAGAPE